jgi:hypothetical protein
VTAISDSAVGAGGDQPRLAGGEPAEQRGQHEEAEADDLTLAEIADEFAIAVRAQWETEILVRRLNDPYPLPVRWVAADATLSDRWDLVDHSRADGADL